MSGVRVRMYRQGLGDAFLLSFDRASGEPFQMLIDCGVVVGTPDAQQRIREVAADIAQETKGRLDALVITHEHWDHLSGFVHAQQEFTAMQIGEIWFAWTEDENDDLAHQLRAQKRKRLEALKATLARMALRETSADDFRNRFALGVERIVQFFGPDTPAATARPGTADALEYLKARTDATLRFFHPGDVVSSLSDVAGFDVFVLGPPRDQTLLRRSDPSRRKPETYDLTADASLEQALWSALGTDGQTDGDSAQHREDRKLAEPFESFYQLPREDADDMAFFKDRYGFEKDSDTAWRRIDDDWLGVAGRLALQLDNDTNNSSLALAFRHRETGKVLLFPGDAQVGSWLSWEGVEWEVRDGDKSRYPSPVELLRQTVLYKVSHHGSHNATLSEHGLELMQHPELAAMIPVDTDVATKKGWRMPFAPLLKRLEERTQGRILRSDDLAVPTRNAAFGGSARAWATFAQAVSEDGTKLYYDYRVPL